MYRFVQGFAAVFAVILLWNTWMDATDDAVNLRRIGSLAMGLCLLPTLGAWGTARLVHTLRPRRLFDAPLRDGYRPFFCGVIAAMITIVVLMVMLNPLGRMVGQAHYIVSAAVLVCLIILMLVCRKRQSGNCIDCGYDISASIVFGRCPECGAAV